MDTKNNTDANLSFGFAYQIQTDLIDIKNKLYAALEENKLLKESNLRYGKIFEECKINNEDKFKISEAEIECMTTSMHKITIQKIYTEYINVLSHKKHLINDVQKLQESVRELRDKLLSQSTQVNIDIHQKKETNHIVLNDVSSVEIGFQSPIPEEAKNESKQQEVDLSRIASDDITIDGFCDVVFDE